MIVKQYELNLNPNCTDFPESIRYCSIFLHSLKLLIEQERDEELAEATIHSIELLGCLLGVPFYLMNGPILLWIVTQAFSFNVICFYSFIHSFS